MRDSRTTGCARHVGRVGALAVALGIGSAIAVPAPAWAEPDTGGADTSQTGTASDNSTDTAPDTTPNPEPAAGSTPAEEPSNTEPQLSGAPTTSVPERPSLRSATPKKKPRSVAAPRRTARTAAAPDRDVSVAPLTPTVQRAVPAEAPPAPVIAAAAATGAVPQSVPIPTLPTPAKVINTVLTALTAPWQGSRSGTTVEFPGLWVLLAAARRQLGLTPAATAASAPAAMTVAAATANAAPVLGDPLLGDPDPTTGAVSGRVVATDPEGARLRFTLLTRPAEGTLTFSSTGAFTYTPTASQRVRAGLTGIADALFTVAVSDGRTGTVVGSVAVPIDPAPVHLLDPVPTGDRPAAVAATDTRAYLVNSASGTVTVVDTLAGTVVSTIPVGTNPIAIVVKADGRTAYVADAANRSIAVVDTATNTVRRQIALNFTPTALAISPSGGAVYIGNATGKMAKLNTSTNRVGAWIGNTSGATSVIVSPNGKRVYVSTPAGIAVYSASSWTNSAKLLAGSADSTAIAVSRDSTTLYTVTGSTVRVLTSTGIPTASTVDAGATVTGATVNKDGTLVFLTTADGDLQVYDTATHSLQTTLHTGAGALAASPDGMQLYVADAAAGALQVVSLVPANQRPTVAAPTGTGDPVTGKVTGSTGVTDADGDPLTITVLTKPTKGTIAFGPDGTFTYTPTATARHLAAADTAPLSALTDTVTITVDDGRRGVVQQNITVAVVPANTAPTVKVTVGRPNSATGVITGTVRASDANRDRIYYDGTAATLTGTLVVAANGKFTYTPTVTARHAAATADPAAKTETVTITVDDGHGGVVAVPVTMSILPRNSAPTAASLTGLHTDFATGRVTGALSVTDADLDPLTFTVPVGPTRGSVVLHADGTFGYTPSAAARAAGTSTDSFTVRIDDGHGATQTMTVSVTVAASTPGDDLPVAGTVTYATNAITGVVTGEIQVSDSSTLSYLLATATPTSGTLTVNQGTGTFVFTPNTVARYRAWFTPDEDELHFTVSVLDGTHGIPVDVSVPISAVHPDVDGTLTLSELRNLALTGHVDIGRNKAGKIRNIDGTFTVDPVTDATSAAAVLNRISTLLGIPAGFARAGDITVSTNDFGSVFYRLNPKVNGLRVLGSELVLSTDAGGTVTGLISNYDPAVTAVSTVPIGPADRASKVIDLLKADVVSDLGGSPSQAAKDAFLATLHFDTELVVYHEDLNNPPQLAWRVNVTSTPDSPYPSVGVRYIVAANGTKPGLIISEFASAQHAVAPVRSSGTDQLGKVRTVVAANTGSSIVLSDPGRNITTYATRYQSTWSGLPSIPGNVVGYTTSWLRSAVSAQANMIRVFDYYTDVLGRDSFDDNGAAIALNIDYNPGGASASGWRNAAWTGSVLVFGDAGRTEAALDLVAHEYTHAVVQYVNGLAYLGESGAMNESYADIMGALIENKTGTARWLFAEDAYGNPYRNMADPSDYRQPEHYGNLLVDPCGCNANDDFDYVHSNSGIMNFAAYKMMEATRDQVSGEQWARVFYDSLYRLPSTAKFVDARYAVISSARAEGFGSAQIDAIKAAFDAVGIRADEQA
ncbi:M4 family metallopeptidase [Mycobacterium sp. MBM]|nr:M4 family metallopeptidase [Mycobacterium sp. MBM]